MQKYFSKAQGIIKFTCLSSIFITIGALSSSNIAYADVNGIPFNRDFEKAEYPYAQALDGCSSWDSKHPEWMRDTWGPVNFSGGCNTHDKCYYTLGSNWQSCNERFYSDLRAACERDLRTSIQVPAPTLTNPFKTRRVDGPPDPIRLPVCYGLASTYYTGVLAGVVKIKWLDTFNKAQDKQRRYEQWVASIRNSSTASNSDPRQKITSFYKDFLSRDPESGVIESRMNALLNGRTLEQQRTDIAFSDEVRQKITSFYKQYLGRDPESGVIESRMNALLNGRTLEQQRVDIQTSPEARSRQ